MENKKLLQIYKTDAERLQIIIDNILIMLSNRIYIKDNEKMNLINLDEGRKNIVDVGNGIYTIKANNKVTYAIKITFSKLTAISKQSSVSDFIAEYAKYKKIIVATEYINRVARAAMLSGAQIFTESCFMEDILSHHLQPKFEVMSPSECELIKKEYNIESYTASEIKKDDPIIKYFDLSKGDIIRIIACSPTSGERISYRMVT